MDLLKLKFPLAVVVSVVSVAIGAGGSVALAASKAEEQAAKILEQSVAIEALKNDAQQARDRLLRIEISTQETQRTVERIEKKLDRGGR